MSDLTITPFKPDTPNYKILNYVRNRSGNDYRDRVPAATQSDISATINALNNNVQLMNEFAQGFVNKVGLTIAKNRNWTNKLAKFKRGMLEFGESIEEFNVGLVRAYVYDFDKDYGEEALFAKERPDVQVDYHHINRENFYKVTVHRVALKRAFTSETGLADLIQQIMATPVTSDNWDEYLAMRELFKHYHDNGGFFRVHIPEIASGEPGKNAAMEALERIREYTGLLEFPNTLYSVSRMPVWANPDDLELFVTPAFQAKLDVQALAGLFNVTYAEVSSRVTIIDRFPEGMEDVKAILTTRDFFVVADTLIDTTSQDNAAGLYENFYYHHHQIISVSRFVPAIAFTTGEGTDVTELTDTVDGVEARVIDVDGATVTDLVRGMSYEVEAAATVDPEDGVSTAAILELIGADYRSYVTQTGVIHISIFEPASSVTLRVTSAVDRDYVVDVPLDIVGDRLILWPNPEVVEDADNDGVPERTPAEPARIGDTVTIPDVTGVQYKVGGTNVANGSQHTVTAAPGITVTAEARAGSELKPGATASWTYVAE